MGKATSTYMLHKADTTHGTSGSPITADDVDIVIGIHNGHYGEYDDEDYNMSTNITKFIFNVVMSYKESWLE